MKFKQETIIDAKRIQRQIQVQLILETEDIQNQLQQ